MINNKSFYTVGSQVYYSKTLALLEATKTNIHPEWHFGDDVFGALLWNSGQASNITDLYQQRASQLREKYDYLVLGYSGGSDSRTALDSFLSQGLKVDELYVCWPKDYSVNKHTVSTSISPDNYLSEFELIIKPDFCLRI